MSRNKLGKLVTEKYLKGFLISLAIVVALFLVQLFIRQSWESAGFPFSFVTMEVTGNVPAPQMGEIYTLKVLWLNLVLDFVLYMALVYPAVRLVGRKLKGKVK